MSAILSWQLWQTSRCSSRTRRADSGILSIAYCSSSSSRRCIRELVWIRDSFSQYFLWLTAKAAKPLRRASLCVKANEPRRHQTTASLGRACLHEIRPSPVLIHTPDGEALRTHSGFARLIGAMIRAGSLSMSDDKTKTAPQDASKIKHSRRLRSQVLDEEVWRDSGTITRGRR